MKSNATISEVMTKEPHTVGAEQTVSFAKSLMSSHGIRHLPVLHGGQVYGIVSDRDLMLVEAVEGPKASTIPLKEVCLGEVFTAQPNTPLKDVAAAMAKDGLGSTVVTDDRGKVVGILTTVDICRVLSTML
jgi:acetoin utilization protein AcuB